MWRNSLFRSLLFFLKLRLFLFFSRAGRVMHELIKWLVAQQKSCIFKEYKISILFVSNWQSTLVYSPLLLMNSPSWHSKIKQMLLSSLPLFATVLKFVMIHVIGWNQNNKAFTDLFHCIVLVFKKKSHYAFLKWFCNSCLPFFHGK